MPVGICPMCQQTKELRDSHLMSRGLYKLVHPPGYAPVSFSEQSIFPTTKQTSDYLLCGDCEQLLGNGGETWVLPRLARANGEFKLYDSLVKMPPELQTPEITVYGTTANPEINREKLIHFGLGFFYKASVHAWGREHAESLIELGEGSEGLRKYLHGQGDFPQNMALVVFVLPKPVSLIGFTEPIRSVNTNCARYHFYVPGMFFNLCVGDDVQEQYKHLCLVREPVGPVILEDVSQDIRDAAKFVTQNAYRSKKLISTQAEIAQKIKDGTLKF
jgi:hypothetical protein